jgi:hypothetical protein
MDESVETGQKMPSAHRMTKEELVDRLRELEHHLDPESAHSTADNLLLEFINDKDVAEAYENIDKWYA